MEKINAESKKSSKNRAPEFEITSVQGEQIKLSNYKGKKVLLIFFRYAGCPICNFHVHDLIKNHAMLQEQNIEVIAIFESSNKVLREYITDSKIPFPVVGNPDLSLYRKYNADNLSSCKMMRTMFRIMFVKKTKRMMKEGEKVFQGKKYEKDGEMTRMPADFLIDPNGFIKIAHYGEFIGDHLTLEEIMK